MKNQILKISMIAMMILTVFGCEKKEIAQVEAEDSKEQMYAVGVYLERTKMKPEKAIIVGTKAELKIALMKEDPALLKIANKGGNVLTLMNVLGQTPDVGPDDLVKKCVDEINAIYDAHIVEWMALANKNCLPVFRCLGCPEVGVGMAMDFVIWPTDRRCNPFAFDQFEEVFQPITFDFGADQYDSAETQEFIKKIKVVN